MTTITQGVSSLIEIRATLLDCKNSEPPDIECYKLPRETFLRLLSETMTIWNSFQDAENLIRSMISKFGE